MFTYHGIPSFADYQQLPRMIADQYSFSERSTVQLDTLMHIFYHSQQVTGRGKGIHVTYLIVFLLHPLCIMLSVSETRASLLL